MSSSNTHNTLEVGHIADLWHAGTERFYRARVIAAIASQEALAPFSDEDGPLKPSSIIERLERYKGCCTEASEAHQILTEAISLISALRRNDEVHWKTRRTLLRELASIKGEDGPGEEDGPWAEGWEVRRGAPETAASETPAPAAPRPDMMRITYQSYGRCLWHDDCDKSVHGIMTEVSRDAAYSLLRCLHCGREGYLPVGVISACVPVESRGELKANACQCDPNPSIGGSPPCPVHDGESEE